MEEINDSKSLSGQISATCEQTVAHLAQSSEQKNAVISVVGGCSLLLTHLPSVTLSFGSLLLVKGHRDAGDLICMVDSLN